jgi:biotin transport system substrate-specific component
MTTAITLIQKTKASRAGLAFLWALSIAALVASSKIQVPLWPVPITLQTAVVLMMPCLLGWRMALSALTAFLALGVAGAPVFAGPVAGPAVFFGPTGGYLLGFAAAMAATAFVFERKTNWSLAALFALMLGGHAVILALGVAWLAFGVPVLGLQAAITGGLVPFLIGTALKAGLSAAVIKASQQ